MAGTHRVIEQKSFAPPSFASVGKWISIVAAVWFSALIVVCTTIGILKEYF